jgi:hypothetical protein
MVGLTSTPSAGQSAEDPRATTVPGDNATTCLPDAQDDVSFAGSTQVGATGGGDAGDGNVSGVSDGQFLDVTILNPLVVIDAIIVKAGNAYNVYGPEDAPFSDLRAPLTNGGQLPEISHWFICYHLSQSNGGTTTTTTTATTATTATTGSPTTTAPAEVLGRQITSPSSAGSVAGSEALARTGSPEAYWYVLAGLAFLVGGLALYSSTIHRRFDDPR